MQVANDLRELGMSFRVLSDDALTSVAKALGAVDTSVAGVLSGGGVLLPLLDEFASVQYSKRDACAGQRPSHPVAPLVDAVGVCAKKMVEISGSEIREGFIGALLEYVVGVRLEQAVLQVVALLFAGDWSN